MHGVGPGVVLEFERNSKWVKVIPVILVLGVLGHDGPSSGVLDDPGLEEEGANIGRIRGTSGTTDAVNLIIFCEHVRQNFETGRCGEHLG